MNRTNNKILITGGASGIGLGLAEKFISQNNTVIICGRRETVLDEISNRYPSVITVVCDLAEETERIRIYNWILANHSDLNVLVNNAGIQNRALINEANFYEKARQEIAINLMAPLHLINLFCNLSSLNTIINVTSGLAFVPLANVPVYSATKSFLHSFSLSLRRQLMDNIEVIEIIPPAINTDLGGKGIHDGQPSVSDFIEAVFGQLDQGKTELTYGFSEKVAQANNSVNQKIFDQLNS